MTAVSAGVSIDHTGYPNIFDAILSHAPLDFFRNLRGTSRAMYVRANAALYSHVCIHVTDRFPPGLPRVTFRLPYSGALIPGLTWDMERERTLARLAEHTRIVDDTGRAAILWEYSRDPAVFEQIGGLALLAALAPSVLRAPALDRWGNPYEGWALAVRVATRPRLPLPGGDGTFPVDLNVNNPLHRVIADTRANFDLPGTQVLLPAATSIVFTTIASDHDPLVPIYTLARRTERAIFNATFAKSATPFASSVEIVAPSPPRLAHVVVLIATPPADNTWTWAARGPGKAGVLQTVKEAATEYASTLRTVTLVGVDRIDPTYYNTDGVAACYTWEARKDALSTLLKPESATEPHPTWRLLTFAEWREEVGDEMYALSTVAPWVPWPEVLPHTRYSTEL